MNTKIFLTTIILLLVFFISLPAAEEVKRRAMTVDDALDMVRIGDVNISPDGKWVFFSKSELDWDKNKRNKKYFMVPSTGGEAFQYIGKEGGSMFQFSPDGLYLAFLRKSEEDQQLFLMRTSGGEAVRLTEHKPGIKYFKWSEDSKKIVFIADEPRTKEEEKEYKKGNDAFMVDEGPHGQNEGKWGNLHIFDLESKKETKLTSEKFFVSEFDVCPDSKRIIFAARYDNRRNTQYLSEIYLLEVESKAFHRLTDNKIPEDALLWAPDGKQFLFTAPDAERWTNTNTKIFLMDPVSKTYRPVSQKFEGEIRGIVWLPDSKSIYFNGQQGTVSNLFQLDIASGAYKQLTDFNGIFRFHSISNDRNRIVYTFTDYKTPEDIYASDIKKFKPVRLTDANPRIREEIALAEMKLIQWDSADGFRIEGLLHLPPGYAPGNEGKPLPLIVHIHGGPAGCFINRFDAGYHIYAGLGYVQLSPNVRGSSGYTDALRLGNTVDKNDGIGKGDYLDLMNGVDELIEQGIADKDRMGLRGWSYGGILGGWTITQTHRFKAASIGAGVYDWTSEYGPGFNHDVRFWHIGGTPWDNPGAYREQSALTHVKNVTTPTLLLHGMNDLTDTEPQSMMFFTALKDQGKTVRYIRFPRERHVFREPRHQRVRDIEDIRWMQKYILGEEWTPPKRPKKEKEE